MDVANKGYIRVTQDDIHDTPNSTINGLDGWSQKAIAGRGILIDYASWIAEHQGKENGTTYNALATHGITVAEINAILAEKGITPRTGDILFLRTGYVAAYTTLDDSGKEGMKTAGHAWPGLQQSEEMTRWLWERQFAAVAGDNPGLECVREYSLFIYIGSLKQCSGQTLMA